MNDPEANFKTYFKSFFSGWLTGMSGPASVPFVFLALYVQSRTQRLLWGCLAVLCAIYAPYEVWRKTRNESYERIKLLESRIRDSTSELVIYPENGSCYYIEIAESDRPIGMYISLCVSVENKGPRNSVVRKIDLFVQETKQKYENIEPARRQNVRTRLATHALRQDWIFSQNSIIVQGHNVCTGIVPIYVPHLPAEDVQELHCTLTLSDTEGVTAQRQIVVPAVGR